MLSEKKYLNIIKMCCFGFFISLIITVFGIFLLSTLLSFTSLGENIIEGGIIFISSFSIIIGSIILLKKVKEKGLAYGGIFGIVYILMLYLISSIIINDFSIGFPTLIMILLGFFSGIIGGIIGVNIN